MRGGIAIAGAALACALAACSRTNPTGPTTAKPTTKLYFVGQLDSNGVADIDLPAAAGTLDSLPSIAAYVAHDTTGPYGLIAAETGYAAQDLVLIGASTDSTHLVVEIVSFPLWYYRLVVIY